MEADVTYLDRAEVTYLERIVDALRSRLAERLIGVYLFGSAATGAYERGVSDLDVQAVVDERLSKHECEDIARSLAHAALP